MRRLQLSRARMMLLVILIAATLFGATASQPFHLDNMDFPAVAKATAKSWIPVYYRGEDAPAFVGLYHPPLYIYTLAAWIRVFGFGHVQVRMLGFACALLQAFLTLAIVQALLGRRNAFGMAVWFLAGFLLNPYTLQAASIADIDSTIYGPLLCGILLAAVRISWRDGVWRTDAVRKREFAWIAALITLALWAKMTTVLLFIGVVPLLLIARLGWRKTALYWAATAGAGIGAFALTFWMYGKITHLDVMDSVRFTIFSFVNRGASAKPGMWARVTDKFDNFGRMRPQHMFWTGFLPWAAAGSTFLLATWRAVRRRSARDTHIAVLSGLALFISAYYCGQSMTFGSAPFKYTLVCWGLVLACPGFMAVYLFGDSAIFTRRALLAGAAMFVAFAAVGDLILRDDLIAHRWNRYGDLLEYGPGVLALVAIATGAAGWKTAGRAALATALGAYMGLSFGIASFQSKAPYSTTYDYGQVGLEDAVGFIRANTGPDDVISCMKDVGFEAERPFFENYGAVYGGPAATDVLKDRIVKGKVAYAVFTEDHGQDQLAVVNPALKQWMEANSTLVRSVGDYRIYRPFAAEARAEAAKGAAANAAGAR